MAPIDQALLKMLNDVVLLIVGGIGGVMSKRAVGAVANAIGTPTPPPVTTTTTTTVSQPPAPVYAPSQAWTPPSGALPTWINPPLDESWTPPPPPSTPPDHMESDHEREQLALARKEVG